MKVYKIKTESERTSSVITPGTSKIFDVKSLPENETVVEYTDYRVRESHPNKNLFLIQDLLKTAALSEIADEEDFYKVLKGNSYIKKVTTTEYFIVDNDGENLVEKLNDDWITSQSCESPYEMKQLPPEQKFYRRGDQVLNEIQFKELNDEQNNG